MFLLCLDVIRTFFLFKDVEVCGDHFHAVAYDAAHWRDTLLSCSSHSESLRDSLAAFAYWLCNTIMSCDDVHALFASFLSALDKCLGIRLIRIGKVSSDSKGYLHD